MLWFPMKCLVRGMSGRGDDKSKKCRVMEMSTEGTVSQRNVRESIFTCSPAFCSKCISTRNGVIQA